MLYCRSTERMDFVVVLQKIHDVRAPRSIVGMSHFIYFFTL